MSEVSAPPHPVSAPTKAPKTEKELEKNGLTSTGTAPEDKRNPAPVTFDVTFSNPLRVGDKDYDKDAINKQIDFQVTEARLSKSTADVLKAVALSMPTRHLHADGRTHDDGVLAQIRIICSV